MGRTDRVEAGMRVDAAGGGAYPAHDDSGPGGRPGDRNADAASEVVYRFAAFGLDASGHAGADDALGKTGLGPISQSDGKALHPRAARPLLGVGAALQRVRSHQHATPL